LFVELSKQIDGLQEAVSKKFEAMEKSMKDRVANIEDTAKKIEKFYKQPMYKAVSESFGTEGTVKKSISQQLADGQINFSS